MNTDLMFSKKSDEWETPQALFDLLDKEFHFEWDAAAAPGNSKVGNCYYSSDISALTYTWTYSPIWLNPPYSKIAEFMKKAHHEASYGATVVCLIPSRTDTKYWHSHVMHAHEIRFIKGRLKFGGCNNSAPFPSCIVVFQGHNVMHHPYPIISTMEQP